MKPSVTAVVVTYNRLNLLMTLVSALRSQTRKLDNILIINNGSTDGTKEWLASQSDLQVVTQPNVGGSGGFYRGIKEAYDAGYDYIWAMDDDVAPRPECLDVLLNSFSKYPETGICVPARFCGEKRKLGEVVNFNLTNPFRDLRCNLLKEECIHNEPIEIEGMSFEGPILKRDVVEKIGFPNKELFIYYDDSDYSYRTVLAGYKVLYVPTAVFDRADLISSISKDEAFHKSKWKQKYSVRNRVYFCHHYGKNLWTRNFGSLINVFRLLCAITYSLLIGRHRYSFSDYSIVWKMYRSGIDEKLGKIG